jgi:hypothetical protein
MSHKEKRKILFICIHNSARSQMAEGFVKSLYPDDFPNSFPHRCLIQQADLELLTRGEKT